ncbi:MAG: SRPBCC family protein [Pseudomonadales bacterium]
MNEVTSEIEADISMQEAWEKLRDLSLPHNYVQGLTKTEITTERREGVGASRKVFSKSRPPLDETVVVWDEGHGFLLKLHQGDSDAQGPFKSSFFRYTIEHAGNRTLLKNSMEYEMKWGLAGVILDKLFLRKVFRSVVRDVLIGQKAFYESGEATSAEKLKQLKHDYKNAA